jgi:hypothetical protein
VKGFGSGQGVLLEGNCGAGDDGRKGYLRRYADLPGELSLGMHPTVKALQRLKRLSRIEAMHELQRVWKHASNRAESDHPHRARRRKKQKSNRQAEAGVSPDKAQVANQQNIDL